MWYTYAMEYYSTIRRNEMMLFAAAQTFLEIFILNEGSKKKRNDITHMWNLKYNMGELTKQKQTHRDNGLVAKGGRE